MHTTWKHTGASRELLDIQESLMLKWRRDAMFAEAVGMWNSIEGVGAEPEIADDDESSTR
jgi:hypothetical protein